MTDSLELIPDETVDVTGTTLEALLVQVVALVKDGWELTEGHEPEAIMYGSGFVASMSRSNTSVLSLKDHVADIQVRKPTREEILAKARAAKKAKLDVNTVQD